MSKPSVRILWLAVLAAIPALRPGAAVAQTAPAAAAEAAPLRVRIRERAQRELDEHSLVGLSVAVIVPGQEVLTEHLGFEDREAGIAASDATMYRWASVSKPMTAVLAMQLAGSGKLDLDADVRTVVPEFPEKPWPITCRQLLCHQGGIVHYANGPVVRTRRGYDTPHPFADAVLALDTFKESPLVAEPGVKYSYTTHGYMLLGAAVQRAGGAPLADLVRARIADPCGMTTLRPDYQWEDIPHRAVGYRKLPGGEAVRSTDTDVSWKLAGGGWISGAADMARFGAGMLGDSLVDARARDLMWTPQKAREGDGGNYGLGFQVGSLRGRRLIEHSGSQEKTATRLAILPDEPGGGVVVAVLCNTEGAALRALTLDLARLASPAPATRPPAAPTPVPSEGSAPR